ncbi:hypothetical protein MLD52_03130 [Puniceicoccaceae bacterium K14]|nr:hypothetical protein [Puniceicoccaceae bacterium K14]
MDSSRLKPQTTNPGNTNIMKIKLICILSICSLFITRANALSINFFEDDPTTLNFEMSNLGPTPGDQSITSPSGTWFVYAFVHQFEPEDEFAEIGAFVAKLLPVPELIGTDVIHPHIRGLADFPVSESAIGEFGDMYTGTFSLDPTSGSNAQQWNWTMTLKTATAGSGGSNPVSVPNTANTLSMFAVAFLFMLTIRKNRLR